MQIDTLQKYLGVALMEQPDLVVLMKHRSQNTFARDPDGQVIGLNLRSNDLTCGNLAFCGNCRNCKR